MLHFLHKIHSFFVQLFHRHFSGYRTQRINKLTFYQFFQLVGRHGFHTQRLRSGGDALGHRFHAHIKLGHHIYPHAVASNQRLLSRTAHFQPQSVHVHWNNFVQYRQHQRATVHNHLLAAETGAHKRHFFGGAAVQPGEDQAEHKQGDKNNARNAADGN